MLQVIWLKNYIYIVAHIVYIAHPKGLNNTLLTGKYSLLYIIYIYIDCTDISYTFSI